ncbi:hypothetical protein [Agrobacterium pusense]|uniref:hypothetical protein n=1 Tax=Agrobacterium pusense TaxID=648995 RepID=UPI002FE37CDB
MCSPKPDGRADHPVSWAITAVPTVEDDRRGRGLRRVVNGSSLAPRAPMFSFEFSGQ